MRTKGAETKRATMANLFETLDDIKYNEGRVLVPIDHSRDTPPHGADVASSLTVRITPDGKTEFVAIYDSDSRKRKFQLPGGRPTLRDGTQEPLLATARKEEMEEAFIQPEHEELVLAAKFTKHGQILRNAVDAENGMRGDVCHYVFLRISDARIAETTDVDAKYPGWFDLRDVFTPGKKFQLGTSLRWAPFALSHIIMIAKTLRQVGSNFRANSKDFVLSVDASTPNDEVQRQLDLYRRMEAMVKANPTVVAAFSGWADISLWELVSAFITDWYKAQGLLDNIELSPMTSADWAKL